MSNLPLLGDDDAVSMQASTNFNRMPMLKVSQMKQELRDLVAGRLDKKAAELWVNEGVSCEILKASTGGGWQKGKLYLRFEFVSDEPPQSDNPESLDALRRELNTD